MRILINHQEVVTEVATVLALVAELKLPAAGVAVAIHHRVVPHDQWAETPIEEGADITIIKAAFGG